MIKAGDCVRLIGGYGAERFSDCKFKVLPSRCAEGRPMLFCYTLGKNFGKVLFFPKEEYVEKIDENAPLRILICRQIIDILVSVCMLLFILGLPTFGSWYFFSCIKPNSALSWIEFLVIAVSFATPLMFAIYDIYYFNIKEKYSVNS